MNGMLILMWKMVLGSVSVERLPQAPKSHLSFFLNLHLKFIFFASKFTNDDPTPPLVIDSDFDLLYGDYAAQTLYNRFYTYIGSE